MVLKQSDCLIHGEITARGNIFLSNVREVKVQIPIYTSMLQTTMQTFLHVYGHTQRHVFPRTVLHVKFLQYYLHV